MRKTLKALNPTVERYSSQYQPLLNAYAELLRRIEIPKAKDDLTLQYILDHFPNNYQTDALFFHLYFYKCLAVVKLFSANEFEEMSKEDLSTKQTLKTVNKAKNFLKENINKLPDHFIDMFESFVGERISSHILEGNFPSDILSEYESKFDEILEELKHYIDLAKNTNHWEIVNFDWRQYKLDDLLDVLKQKEASYFKKYPAKKKELPYDSAFIEFDDGYKWLVWASPDSSELAVKGLCGMVESWMDDKGNHIFLVDDQGEMVLDASYYWIGQFSGKIGERALSTKRGEYTKPKEFTKKLDYGVFGQIRGHHNSKPEKKYHKYIAALMSDTRAIWHIPDSFRPEDQFYLTDLETKYLKEIDEENPTMLHLPMIVDKLPLFFAFEILREFDFPMRELKWDYADKIDPEYSIRIGEYNAEDIFKLANDDGAKHALYLLEDGYSDYHSDRLHAEDVENLLSLTTTDKKLEKTFNQIAKKYNLNVDDEKELIQQILNNKDLKSAFWGASDEGNRIGILNEYRDQLKDRYNELLLMIDANGYKVKPFISERNHIDLFNNVTLYSPIKNYLQNLQDEYRQLYSVNFDDEDRRFSHLFEDEGDSSFDYAYGFDDEAAVYYLQDQLNELLD